MSILGHESRRGAAPPRAGLRAAFGAAAGTFALLVGPRAYAGDAGTAAARSGDYIVYAPRPAPAKETRACSFRHALCVHAGPPAPAAERDALAWLAALDRAWDVATGALALPPPDPAIARSSGVPAPDALDVYLVDGPAYATRVVLDRRDPLAAFDRASAFALAGRGALPGCSLDTAAAQLVARAILYRVAPATDEGSALATSASIASLMNPCVDGSMAQADADALFQGHPELGLADTLAPPSESIALPTGVEPSAGETYARGAARFYDWIDRSFGGYPGAVVRALWALSPTVTAGGAARWNDDPDGFDVLRESFKGALTTGSTVDDLWLDFAVARAFEASAPVRVDWSIAWPTTPRTLRSAVGVAPTGAAYVSVDCAGRPRGSRLRFEARWEEHARLLWTLVRVGADGREISRVAVPHADRGTDAQTTLVDLDGAARVLVVGSNAGDPLTPFDPDDYVWEPHGWVVSLASE